MEDYERKVRQLKRAVKNLVFVSIKHFNVCLSISFMKFGLKS